jgi:hypothetical protein
MTLLRKHREKVDVVKKTSGKGGRERHVGGRRRQRVNQTSDRKLSVSVSVSAEISVSVCISVSVSVSLHLSVSAEISVQNRTENRNLLRYQNHELSAKKKNIKKKS